MWGCFSSKGPGKLVWVHGIMKYQELFNLNLAAPARKLKLGRCWIFQQDNDPKNMSKSAHKWCVDWKQNQASAMAILVPWPKPVDWAEEERAQERPRNRDDLKRFCKGEWFQVPFSVFYNLIRCYRRRPCCFIGKGKLYKVLNAGVPIIVAHMVLLIKTLIKKQLFFSQNKFTSIKGWIFLIVYFTRSANNSVGSCISLCQTQMQSRF